MRSFGDLQRIGVDCTCSYDAGVLRYGQAAGADVLEVTAPDKLVRRRRGNSDEFDAQTAAHAAFAERRTVTPRSRDGLVESLRVLQVCRKTAVQARRIWRGVFLDLGRACISAAWPFVVTLRIRQDSCVRLDFTERFRCFKRCPMPVCRYVAIALCWIHLLTGMAHSQQTKSFDILDSQGFNAPIVAYSLQVPQDWQVSGEVLWAKPCSGNDLYEVVFTGRSPDGLTGMRILPGHQVIWLGAMTAGLDHALAQMMVAQTEAQLNKLRTQFRNTNCHVGHDTGTEQLFQTLVKPARPADMRVIATMPNDIGRKQFAQVFDVAAPGMQSSYDAVRIDIAYNLGPHPIEESLWLSWYLFQPDPSDPVMAGTYQQTFVEPLRLTWVSPNRRAVDQAKIDALVASIKVNPDWQNRINEVQRKRTEANRRNNEENGAQREAERARAEALRDTRESW